MVPGQVSAPRDVLAAGCSSPRRLPGELAPSPARPLLPPSASAGFAILPGSRRDFESFVLTRPGRELRPGASTRCSSPTSIGTASGRRPPCCNPPASARLGEGQPAEPARHGACPHGMVPVPMARRLSPWHGSRWHRALPIPIPPLPTAPRAPLQGPASQHQLPCWFPAALAQHQGRTQRGSARLPGQVGAFPPRDHPRGRATACAACCERTEGRQCQAHGCTV